MGIKISKVMTTGDWVKMTILLIAFIICWTWVWVEYRKPLIPQITEQEFIDSRITN